MPEPRMDLCISPQCLPYSLPFPSLRLNPVPEFEDTNVTYVVE
jgi:hypothetical protein